MALHFECRINKKRTHSFWRFYPLASLNFMFLHTLKEEILAGRNFGG